MMWTGGSWGVGGWLVMTLMMLVLWGALVGVAVWLVRSSRSGSSGVTGVPPGGTGPADEILAERFVRGEIDEAEFSRRRQALRGAGGRSRCGDQR